MIRKDYSLPKSETGLYRILVVLGIFVVFLITFLGLAFFQVLSDNQINSSKFTLNKQAELASKQIEKRFTAFYDDMSFFVRNLEPDTYDNNESEILAFEKRARRIFNNHRDLLDTIKVIFPNKAVIFHFDNRNNFINTFLDKEQLMKEMGQNEVFLDYPSKNVAISATVNLERFFIDELTNYYLGISGEKLIYCDGKLRGTHDQKLKKGFFLDQEVLDQISAQVEEGLKGDFNGKFVNENEDLEFEALVQHYPFSLFPLKSKFTTVFVVDRNVVTTGILAPIFI